MQAFAVILFYFTRLMVCCYIRYQQLLSDCHHCYFQQRLTLLSASVSTAITDLVNRHSRDHCALVSHRTCLHSKIIYNNNANICMGHNASKQAESEAQSVVGWGG